MSSAPGPYGPPERTRRSFGGKAARRIALWLSDEGETAAPLVPVDSDYGRSTDADLVRE
ncbi:hypothetical protein [Streptomyces sp. NPDC088350]|uniref:hypothetical protein n=1 Tax=Streptomyces sp. NPDC088350 TaxID=3365854 RepID=UPI0038111879